MDVRNLAAAYSNSQRHDRKSSVRFLTSVLARQSLTRHSLFEAVGLTPRDLKHNENAIFLKVRGAVQGGSMLLVEVGFGRKHVHSCNQVGFPVDPWQHLHLASLGGSFAHGWNANLPAVKLPLF